MRSSQHTQIPLCHYRKQTHACNLAVGFDIGLEWSVKWLREMAGTPLNKAAGLIPVCDARACARAERSPFTLALFWGMQSTLHLVTISTNVVAFLQRRHSTSKVTEIYRMVCHFPFCLASENMMDYLLMMCERCELCYGYVLKIFYRVGFFFRKCYIVS